MTITTLLAVAEGIDVPRPVQPVYRWHSCDLRTGRRQEVFPLVGSPSRVMGGMTTLELTCDLAGIGDKDFWGSTRPRQTMIALERQFPDQDTSDIPWVGAVISRPNRGSDDNASLSCVSFEGILQRRFVATHTYTEQPGDTDAQIITDLLGDANVEGWNIQLDLASLTTTRNVRFKAPERRTVLSCLQELADMDGGPEWTINGAWNGLGDAVVVTLKARPRLGTASTMPNAQFRYPGVVRQYNQGEDHSEGKGGNAITAVGQGQGAATPSAIARNEARILVEGRWESILQASSARTQAQLLSAARSELGLEIDGQSLYTLTADATRAPSPDVDWVLGDDVALVVEPGTSSGHPAGLDIIARGIGWTIDPDTDTLTPLLWQPSEGDTA